jgi:hypothetical protein
VHPARAVVAALVFAFVIAACGDAAVPSDDGASTQPPAGASSPAGAASPSAAASDRNAKPDPSAVALEATFGRWRPAPIHLSAATKADVVAACRADPLVGDAPLVVTDARGEGLFTLVFAGAEPAICRASLEDEAASPEVVVRAFADGDAPDPEPEHLGGHDLEVVDQDTRPRIVLVGRVGDGVPEVSVNHDDATWTKAAIDHGWYAVWWPLAKEAIGVAAVDRRNTVVDSYPPHPDESTSPSP